MSIQTMRGKVTEICKKHQFCQNCENNPAKNWEEFILCHMCIDYDRFQLTLLKVNIDNR